jgi:hypothetical protein
MSTRPSCSSSREGPIEKKLSRIDLERERHMIEQRMHCLEQKKSKRQLRMQQERIKILLEKDTTVCTTVSTASSEESDQCKLCCRKDRVIHRQRHEIESLRQQLKETQMNKSVPVPVHLIHVLDDGNDSVLSGVTERWPS